MARIESVDPGQATGKAKELLDGVQKKLGMVPNLMGTMAHSPAVLQSYLEFSGALGGASLSAAQREQIAVAIAAKNECDYCLAAHTVIGKGAGVSPTDLEAAQTGGVSDPKASAAIDLARSVVERRGFVDDSEAGRRWFAERADEKALLVTTGGLGPTGDDRTREMIARGIGVDLDRDEAVWEGIRSWLRARGIREEPGHPEQARLPVGATVFTNARGSAPGFSVATRGGWIVAMPGVPSEMYAMVEASLLPWMRERGLCGEAPTRRVLRLFGIPESRVGTFLDPWMRAPAGSDPVVGITVSRGTMSVTITSSRGTRDEREARVDDLASKVADEFGEAVFGRDDDELATVTGTALMRTNTTIALAESCTGGAIASALIDVPGISRVFLEGAVTYSNDAKMRRLGVPRELLATHGAVSEPVALAMAEGIASETGAALGLGVTGIAGPGGGTAEKPVGLVFLGLAHAGRTEVSEHRFTGSRGIIRRRATLTALDRIRLAVQRTTGI